MPRTKRIVANRGLDPTAAVSPGRRARSERFGCVVSRVVRRTNRKATRHPPVVRRAPAPVQRGSATARSERGAVSEALVARGGLGGAATCGESRSSPDPTEQLKAALRKLLAAVLERTLGMALDKVEQLSRTFDEIAARGGFKVGALFGGVRAAVTGGNPVWGAIKGGFSALSPGAKAALVAVLVLALLLLPVTVVLLLILVIVVAVVVAVQTRSRTP